MINKYQAKKFCGEDISLIENYDKAIADTTQVWHCHHIWETMLGYSREELKEMDEYYGIPAINLIFLTPGEHMRLHSKGNKYAVGKGTPCSEERKEFLRKLNTGRKRTEGSKEKNRIAHLGRKQSEETKKKRSVAMTNGKLSKPVLQFTKTGEFVREWPSAMETQRNGFNQSCVSNCCNGKANHHKGYIWKYK